MDCGFCRSLARLRVLFTCAAVSCALTQTGCQLWAPIHPWLASNDLQARLGVVDRIEFDERSAFSIPLAEDRAAVDGEQPEELEEIPTPPPGEEVIPAPAKQVELRLEDVRASALHNNLTLQIDLMNPRIERTGISEEMARFESTFASSISRDRSDLPPGFTLGGPPDTAVGTVGASVDTPLQTGGNIRFNHDTNRTDPLITGLPTVYASSLGVSFTQPLLRGAGIHVNTTPIQVAIAQTGISGSRAKLTAINVLADVERAYWRLYGARLELEVQREQLRIAQQVLDDTLRRIELNAIPARQTPKAERLRAESGLAQRRNLFILSETNVRLAERGLKRIMQQPDLPVDGTTAIIPLTPPEPRGVALQRAHLTGAAVDNRMEMLELQLQLLINELDIGVQHNATLPRVDFRIDYESTGFEPTLGGALDDSLDGRFSDRLLMFALEIPLSGNVQARSRLRRAQLRRARTLLAQDRLKIAIRQEVNDASDVFEQNWRRVVATKAATKATLATYEAEEIVHLNGGITATQLLEAAQNVAIAQADEIRSLVDYQTSKVDLAVATGTMLGYGQIYWHEHPHRLPPH